jgi:C_GCAxxG_C_C family probable redox protein
MTGWDYQPGEAGSLALEQLGRGLYCAEAVVATFARRHGLDADALQAMATGFCSGMGRTGGTCGALTGATMALGLTLGRRESSDSVEPAFAAVQALVSRFAEEFGATGCKELLGCDGATPEGRLYFKDHQLWRRCRVFTARAADLCNEIAAAGVEGNEPT